MLSAEVIEGVVFIYWNGALAGTVDVDRETRAGVDLVARGVYVEDPETYGVAWNCGLACSSSESFNSPEEFEAETGTAIPARTASRRVGGEELECLEDYGEGTCSGPVEYHSLGSGNAFPRCEKHWSERLDRYENSIEQYADSDVAPSWFDPADAGERWDDDY